MSNKQVNVRVKSRKPATRPPANPHQVRTETTCVFKLKEALTAPDDWTSEPTEAEGHLHYRDEDGILQPSTVEGEDEVYKVKNNNPDFEKEKDDFVTGSSNGTDWYVVATGAGVPKRLSINCYGSPQDGTWKFKFRVNDYDEDGNIDNVGPEQEIECDYNIGASEFVDKLLATGQCTNPDAEEPEQEDQVFTPVDSNTFPDTNILVGFKNGLSLTGNHRFIFISATGEDLTKAVHLPYLRVELIGV